MCLRAFLAQKWLFFGPKLQFLKLRSTTCESRSRPPPLSFLLNFCVIVLHTHRYHAPKFHLNLKHHDGVLIFTHFARDACLLAAAAAKPGRSTLDTKKGNKTKTGSTSSVTLTLPCGARGTVSIPWIHCTSTSCILEQQAVHGCTCMLHILGLTLVSLHPSHRIHPLQRW